MLIQDRNRFHVAARSSAAVQGLLLQGGGAEQCLDELVVERPLQVTINTRPLMVTMRTPGDDGNLVRGLLFTEGIISKETPSVQIGEHVLGEISDTLDVRIPEIYLCDSLFDNRALGASSSCGICGIRSLGSMLDDLVPLSCSPSLPFERLPELATAMRREQRLFRRTGGCHAAAIFSCHEELLVCAEDIGRHNAVDKAIGALLNATRLDESELMMVSGRISLEILLKAYRAGIPLLAAVSAPSSMAVELAQKLGIVLAGFCRDDRVTLYTQQELASNHE